MASTRDLKQATSALWISRFAVGGCELSLLQFGVAVRLYSYINYFIRVNSFMDGGS